MRPKISNSELAKQYFFSCSCNLKYFISVYPKLADEKIIKLININELKWRDEFQCKLKIEILTTNNFSTLLSYYDAFLMSLTTYESMFDLFLILAKVIFVKCFYYNDLFTLFYQLVLFDFNQNQETKNDFSFKKNLLEYFRENDFKKYQKALDTIKKIIAIDIFKETENKLRISKILSIADI